MLKRQCCIVSFVRERLISTLLFIYISLLSGAVEAVDHGISSKAGWTVDDVPDPMSNPHLCSGRKNVSATAVCDPEDILTHNVHQELDGAPIPCASRFQLLCCF